MNSFFTQGGQTQLHRLRMFKQVVGATLKVSLWITLGVFCLLVYLNHTWHEFWLVGVHLKAWFMTNCPKAVAAMSPSSIVYFRDGSSQYIHDYVNVHSPQIERSINLFLLSGLKLLIQSILIGLVGSGLVSWFWVRMGKKTQAKEIISGLRLVTSKTLAKRVKKDKGGVSPYSLADVPMPKNAEYQHLMITGTTGSGKSNAIHHLLKQIRENGDQAVVVDTTGTLLSRFYREETDVILNPLDARSTPWNLWKEIAFSPTEEATVSEITETFVPDVIGQDPFWAKTARTVLGEAILRLMDENQMSYKSLYEMIVTMPQKDLQDKLKGTPATLLVDGSVEKTVLSIRMTLVESVKIFKCLEEVKTGGVSLLDRMVSNDKGWIFIGCVPGQRKFLQTLLDAQISLVIKGVMARPEVSDQDRKRLWIVIDELASLKKIPAFEMALEEIRKAGGCLVIGFQDLGQLERIYGESSVKTISNLIGTKVLLRCEDANIAARNSKYFGEQEVKETSESISFGAHQMRDGVSLSEKIHMKALVTATDIVILKDLQAYLKFFKGLPAAKIEFEYLKKIQNVAAFVPKPRSERFRKYANFLTEPEEV